MNRILLIAVLMFVLLGAGSAFAQDGAGDQFAPPERDNPNRARILKRELGLSVDQMKSIRLINVTSRPKMRAAQMAFREARHQLDAAIYADELNEDLIRTKLRAVIEAQAELTRLRTISEAAVRKVLTPEQLLRFRELRMRFSRRMEDRDGPMSHRRDNRTRDHDRDEQPPPPPPMW